MNILLDLYIQFFIIGATSFGGGYAVLPLINAIVVEKKGWLTVQEMTDLVSISNMTPGPISINSATFIGTKMAGLPGSFVATMGFVTPSFLLMMVLAYFLYASNKKLKIFDKMLKTLRPTVVGLIAIAALSMTKNSLFVDDMSPASFSINIIPLICFVIGFALYWKKVGITKLIGLGAVLGVILNLIM